MATKKKTVKDLAEDMHLLTERVSKMESTMTIRNFSEIREKINYLENIIKVYDMKIRKLDNLTKESSIVNSASENIKSLNNIVCRVCGEIFRGREDLLKHQSEHHGQTFKCIMCDQVFLASFKMEEHMKSHRDVSTYKCSICNKEFFVKWRLDKHVKSHSERVNFCHYFNNRKPCPYQSVGCKFRHEESPLCKFRSECTFLMCQFKHIVNESLDVSASYVNIDITDPELSDDEDLDSVYDENSLTDYETTEYDKIDAGWSTHKECGACSRVLTVGNSYKCKKCGETTHRSNCNKWFSTVKKYQYCGGCVYDFKPCETAS